MSETPVAILEIVRKLEEARADLNRPGFLFETTRRTLRARINRLESELHDLTYRPGKENKCQT